MSKGLSLAEFRAQFESDAVMRCKQQEVTIKNLHEKIASMQVQILAMAENQKRDAKQIDRINCGVTAASDKDFVEKGMLFMQRETL